MKASINKSIINQVLKINTNKSRHNIAKLVKKKKRSINVLRENDRNIHSCTQKWMKRGIVNFSLAEIHVKRWYNNIIKALRENNTEFYTQFNYHSRTRAIERHFKPITVLRICHSTNFSRKEMLFRGRTRIQIARVRKAIAMPWEI